VKLNPVDGLVSVRVNALQTYNTSRNAIY